MALATFLQLDSRTPGGIPDDDQVRAQAVLDDVSAYVLDLVGDETSQVWEDDGAPAAVVAVVCAASARSMVNPYQHASVTEGSFTWRADNTSGVWLTSDEKATVRRAAGIPGWASVEIEHHYGFVRYPVDEMLGS